ncbi:MAG: hypothetical protein OJF60_000227 [Burkholderiaceae bacterium]|jgi:hypothetical protein|nr:MAG: hypothetical protein OJF60_000227 [Burkholderiaceae bacterium]
MDTAGGYALEREASPIRNGVYRNLLWLQRRAKQSRDDAANRPTTRPE